MVYLLQVDEQSFDVTNKGETGSIFLVYGSPKKCRVGLKSSFNLLGRIA